MTDSDRLSWIEQLLTIFWDGDDHGSLFWRTPMDGSDGIAFYAICSDTFYWSCADLEDIELPSDLNSLREALNDSVALEKGYPNEEGKQQLFVDWVTLWCCRKRGMRPMNAWMGQAGGMHAAERALFEAAGPARESMVGAP